MKIIGRLLSGVLFLIFSSTVISAVWLTGSPDKTGDVGGYTSIVVDSENGYHISYYDYSNGDLKYAYFNSGTWTIQTLDWEGDTGLWTDIDVDSTNNPHISYYSADFDYDLKYIYFDGTDWHDETIDSSGDVGRCTSIKLDSSDYPGISYFDSENGALKYAHWNGAAWDIQTVDNTGNVGEYTSIDFDSNDYPHITYMDYLNWDLLYAHWNGTVWEYEIVDSSGVVGQYGSIQLNSKDEPGVSYTGGALKYAVYTSTSGWVTETVDSDGTVGLFTGLALDQSDNPHIIYYDWDNEMLKYAENTTGTWAIQVVDNDYRVGKWASVDLKKDDNIPVVSYLDENQGYLKWGYFLDNYSPVLDWPGNIQFSGDGLSPNQCNTGIDIYFAVLYSDPDGDDVLPGYPRVHILKSGVEISGSPFELYKSTYFAVPEENGYIRRFIDLQQGDDYTYYFEAFDVKGSSAVGDPTQINTGPVIINSDPELDWIGTGNYSDTGLYPITGVFSDEYIFKICYSDAENNPPAETGPKVILENIETQEIMQIYLEEEQPSDQNWIDGKVYKKIVQFNEPGTFKHHFYADDGYGGIATGEPVIEKFGPEVLCSPRPVLSWVDEPGYKTRGVNRTTGYYFSDLVFKVKFTDIYNDQEENDRIGLHVFQDSVEIKESPFGLLPKDKYDLNTQDGKIYQGTINLPPGEYTYYFRAVDQTGVEAEGLPTQMQSGLIIKEHFAGKVVAIPNPVDFSKVNSFKFINLIPGSEILIIDISGKQISRFKVNDKFYEFKPEREYVTLSSGIYIFKVTTPNRSLYIGKFAVIK